MDAWVVFIMINDLSSRYLRPRLGIMLHRVVGVGLIYFVLASIEGCTRALQPRNSSQNQASTQPTLFVVPHTHKFLTHSLSLLSILLLDITCVVRKKPSHMTIYSL